MSAKCLCGSGKSVQECHGTKQNKRLIRNVIKYDVLGIGSRGKISIGSYFKDQGFEKIKRECIIKFWRVSTPAGEIIYPLLLIEESKAIRPITIDGVNVFEEKGEIILSLFCMLTPISRGFITIDMSTVRSGKNLYLEGECILESNGDPFSSIFAIEHKDNRIKLYHHTASRNKEMIKKSSYLKASKWNLQGTDELIHHHYVYFTDLDFIEDAFDLLQIGMAKTGTSFMLQTDDGSITKECTVYREEPENRDAKLAIWVEPEMIAPNQLILHEPQHEIGNVFSWWEVFNSSIFRVPVQPKKYLPIEIDNTLNGYKLVQNEYFRPPEGFLAGHGMDMISMLRILSEVCAEDLPREGDPSPADLGQLDPLWIKTWKKNLSEKTLSILREKLTKQ